MSAAEEDTELRDLLIHTLENNGVLNKIKAELRASVFLALEEQERAENKPSLINESLRQFLATRDGRLVAGLITDFLQHFHLDFTLAVLQPEACLPSAPDERTSTCRELGLPVSKAPLLLELVRQSQRRDAARPVPQELPPEDLEEAQAKFKQCRRGDSREVGGEELRALLADLCPHFSRSMLDRYMADELAGRGGVDEQGFLAMYRRLFMQCRSVVTRDLPPGAQPHGDPSKTDLRQEEDDLEGDSFFDDPIPKPEKTYGWKEESNGAHPGATHSQSSLSGSTKVSDQDGDGSLKELRSPFEKAANEEDYMDDFHSSSQRSELSIGEDLEEELSVDDLTASDHKLEELTLDNSISHLSDVADYLEDIS
ncbi:centrosomal protein 43 [Bufo gargarizans]|uniref:centrosomal protein 43 n=1 Tax=Bufo gargarizans TaxID=30331 RepID=UPI001CF31ABC|nr:centrosomal protein 43 [Bufo gargarizans]